MRPTKARLALTCGDPAGIGPEVATQWLRAHPDLAPDVAVIGPRFWLESLPEVGAKVQVGDDRYVALPGKPTPEGAQVAWDAMERAASGTREGEFSGVVTGPVSKLLLAGVGYLFAGQTEFFAARWGGEPTMAFAGGAMRVVLATWHIPLRQVPERLDPPSVERAVLAAAELARAHGVIEPRIGVCGLNPHAGEGGLLGSEEEEWINPTLLRLRERAPGASLCQPADSLFRRHLQGEFDVVVALYHDQGLAALKTVDFDDAVNITLGLPHVRTSPDHGTAFGIAGTGEASARSFGNAVALALRLIARRG